jgi:hypothetical protein
MHGNLKVDQQLLLDEFRRHHKLAADIARFIGRENGIVFNSKDRVVRYSCNHYYMKRSTLDLYDYYSQAIMEYRLTGGWGITRLGGKILVNADDEWDTKIMGWKLDDDNLKMVQDKSIETPKGYKPLVDYNDNYIIGGVLLWGFNLGDKMKIPNQTHIRDHKLEQQERDKRKKTKDIFTKSLLMGAAAALEKEKQEQAEREQK